MAKGRAPGKVIICGEHAVVHGSAAVAAAIGLYTQAEITSPSSSTGSASAHLRLLLVDLDLTLEWSIHQLHSSLLELHHADPTLVTPCTDALTIHLKHLVDGCNISCDANSGVPSGVMAFLFLYASIVGLKAGSVRVESKIPMSCGLGSSAAFSVAVSSALLAFTRQVGKGGKEGEWLPVSEAEADLVNGWAFEAEKIIHGKPSGIDNTVSTYGNIVKYKKAEITHLGDLPTLRILLTNTKVLRNTKQLVAGVGFLREKHQGVLSAVFEAVNAISEELIQILQSDYNAQPSVNDSVSSYKTEGEQKLEELFAINQALLQAMGVSHPSIEKICGITGKYNLKSKLTGAGGGGCVMTLLPRDFPVELLKLALADLTAAGFESFEAELGAKGAQVAN